MFAELEEKALTKALEFFGTLASGERPKLPEAWGAEILAHALAKVAGVPVPEPMPDAGPAEDERPQKVGGMIKEVPEAATLLLAHGWKRKPPRDTILVLSAFLNSPGAQWSGRQIAERMPVPITPAAVNGRLFKMGQMGLLTRTGHGVYTLKTN